MKTNHTTNLLCARVLAELAAAANVALDRRELQRRDGRYLRVYSVRFWNVLKLHAHDPRDPVHQLYNYGTIRDDVSLAGNRRAYIAEFVQLLDYHLP